MDNNFYSDADRRNIVVGDALFAFPMTGLISEDSNFKLGHVSLLKFNRHEWWTVEKSAMLDDWEIEYSATRPLWAYFSVPSVIKNEITCFFLINTLVESLRIFKKGFILEPEYTVICHYHENSSTRKSGIFRSKYIEAILGEDARSKALHIYPEEYENIEQLYSNLIWLKINHFEAISGILDCFNVISVPILTDKFVVQNLFICFEMLFGNGQEFEKYNCFPNERAINLLLKCNNQDTELHHYLLNEMHPYRNKIQHGTKIKYSELIYNLNMLEAIVRIGIQQYFTFIFEFYNGLTDFEQNSSTTGKQNIHYIFNKNLS